MNTVIVGTGTMGQNQSLLYWRPILQSLANQLGTLHIFLSHQFHDELDKNITIMPSFNFYSLFGFRIPGVSYFYGLLKSKPDVLVLSEFGILSITSLIYAKLLRKPRTVLLVENHPKYLIGYGKRRESGYSFLRKTILRLADVIVANNESARDYIIKELGINSGKVTLGPYLTSVRKSTDVNTNNLVSSRMVFFSAGQAIERKGYQQLIREVANLPDHIKEKIIVKVAGGGPELEALRQKVKTLDLDNVINFVGPISYDSVTQMLAESNIFIMPTLGDYRSLALFEALSAGLPLLASCYDGSSMEAVIPGVNGEVFDPLNFGEMSRHIVAMVETQKIKEYSEASARHAKSFTIESATNSLQSAINKATQKDA